MKEYHYVLTVQWTNRSRGTTTQSTQGTFTPSPGTTRESVLRTLLDEVMGDEAPSDDRFSIVFWSLEPNELERPVGRQM